LSDSEIDRMVKSAEQHASEDKNRREQIEQRNQLDSLIYRVEKDSKEWVDRLPADAKSRLDAALEGAKQALRGGDADVIRKALDELNAAYSAAGATLYQGAQAQGGEAGGDATGQQPGGQTPGQDDVVEADYEIVDDKK
jgi:molecular chaperone DnaK